MGKLTTKPTSKPSQLTLISGVIVSKSVTRHGAKSVGSCDPIPNLHERCRTGKLTTYPNPKPSRSTLISGAIVSKSVTRHGTQIRSTDTEY